MKRSVIEREVIWDPRPGSVRVVEDGAANLVRRGSQRVVGHDHAPTAQPFHCCVRREVV